MLKHFHLTRRQWIAALKWTIYALMLLLVLIIQDVVLSKQPPFGRSLQPVPVYIVCVCVREGPERGGLFALIASVFWCLSGADYGNLSVALLPIGSILGAVLCRAALTVRFLPTFLCCAAVCLINDSVIFAFKLVLTAVSPDQYYRLLLPGWALSLLSVPVLYFPVKAISRIGGRNDL